MSDNITLPREVVGRLVATWERDTKSLLIGHRMKAASDLMDILRTALAAEQPKPEPVATVGTQSAAWKGYDGRWSPPGDPIKVGHLLRDLPLGTLLYAAPPEDEALRRDAERYRWLREKDGIAVDVTVFGSMEANLDAAIDAAMEDKT